MTPIIPSMKVGQLLEAYPALEETLIGLSPQFKKLNNPVLRRTVAKVVTLQQAAATGGIPLPELINTLRAAAGQPALELEGDAAASDQPAPEWMNQNRPITRLDVTNTIQSGGVPLGEIQKAAEALDPGSVLELIAPLHPAPVIDQLRTQGFESWARPEGDLFHTFFTKA